MFSFQCFAIECWLIRDIDTLRMPWQMMRTKMEMLNS